MNITEQKSRSTNKLTTNSKNVPAPKEKTKRKRRDDSSDSPGSPPGVFKLTHHKLR